MGEKIVSQFENWLTGLKIFGSRPLQLYPALFSYSGHRYQE